MANIDKVIKGLEGIYRCVSPVNHTCGDCPYQDNHVECKRRALNDALNLLKDQEPVAPYVDSEGITINCGNCGETVGYYPAGSSVPDKKCVYCPECGRKVKWNA